MAAPLVAPPWPVARRRAAEGAALLGAERVAVGDADRRVLAESVHAASDLPAFPTSSMDGWAVSGSGPWEVVGEVLAGTAPGVALEPGQACGIATGAAVPGGATGVVRTEHGEVSDGLLRAPDPPAGAEIRPQGEECRRGDVLVPAATRLRPAHLGLAAAAGVDEVTVGIRPRVRVLLLGDELVTSGVAGVGAVRDSLGPQLPGWLDRLGATVEDQRRVPDTLAEHVAAIDAARGRADVVVTTGGTAAGPVDHLHDAVRVLGGTFVVDSVAVRPGHPMALGALPGPESSTRWLLALPGNPQSAVVALMTLGAPLLDALLGRPLADLPEVELGRDAPAPASEHRLLACELSSGVATPVAYLGSAMLRGLATSDGFAVLPPGGAAAGTRVPWLALPE